MAACVRVLHSALALVLLSGLAGFIANGSFEEGVGTPTGWRLEGRGAWERADDGRIAAVTGDGEDVSYWRTTTLALQPNRSYRLSFRYAAEGGGGCVIAGTDFANCDFPIAPGWRRAHVTFATPADTAGASVRLGQWHLKGKALFDDVRLTEVQPVYRRAGGLVLGEGEQVANGAYTFRAPLGSEGGNCARPLKSFTASFNTNRWVFTGGTEVVYAHRVGAARERSAAVELNCSYHMAGAGVVEASVDGARWVPLTRFSGVGPVRAALPAPLFPAADVLVRVRAEAGDAFFQVDSYAYGAQLAGDGADLAGATAFAEAEAASPKVRLCPLSLPAMGEEELDLEVENLDGADHQVRLTVAVTPEGGLIATNASALLALGPGVGTERVPCPPLTAGLNTVAVEAREDGEVLSRATMEVQVPAIGEAAFGYALDAGPQAQLWWCEATYKVSQTRPLPRVMGDALTLEAARNEYEPAQVVIRPRQDLTDVRVRASDLTGTPGRIAAKNVTIAQVEYVNVTRPTDAGGAAGIWPDPLPPFEQGRALKAGSNYPLWVTVCVPEDQAPGVYAGELDVEAKEWRATVPVRLTVWDFVLPHESHLQTAFGLSVQEIRRYHNLESTDELRQVMDLYFRDFAAHRIAPYDPAPLDPIRVEFSAGTWEGGAYDADRPHAGARSLKVADASTTESVAARCADVVTVDRTRAYALRWWARTERPAQPYLVTVSQYDADEQWISGNNVDLLRTGTGAWERESATIEPEQWNERTRSARIFLRPAPWTEAGEATGTAWFDDLYFGPQGGSENLLKGPGFEEPAGELEAKVDFAAFDRECQRCLDGLGFNTVLVGLRGMPGGTFQSRSPGRIGAFAQGTPEYERLMASQGRQIVQHLRAKGWLGKAYTYWFDEPDPKDYGFVAEGMELLKRAAPGLRRMLTEQPEEALAGRVDLWCPLVSTVGPQAIASRKQQGEHFWWYLCTEPKWPCIGLFIDRPAADLRAWAWLSRKWGVEGQLVWSANYWTSEAAFPAPKAQNPWTDPMSYVSGYDFRAGQVGCWGNGDGRFLYPPNRDVAGDRRKFVTGPVDSIRWEMLREGVEDYEYFCILEGLIARAEASGKVDAALLGRARRLLAVPDAVIRDERTYSKSPLPLYEHRRQLAQVIVELSNARKSP